MYVRRIVNLFAAGTRTFFLVHNVSTGYGAHPAAYSVKYQAAIPGGKAAVV
jgi:hypothetical protein